MVINRRGKREGGRGKRERERERERERSERTRDSWLV